MLPTEEDSVLPQSPTGQVPEVHGHSNYSLGTKSSRQIDMKNELQNFRLSYNSLNNHNILYGLYSIIIPNSTAKDIFMYKEEQS